jgi:DNA-binding XRE family transcriptional regulator
VDDRALASVRWVRVAVLTASVLMISALGLTTLSCGVWGGDCVAQGGGKACAAVVLRIMARCYDLHMRISGIDPATVLIGIGAEVKRRRQLVGLSQTKLAKKAGVHPNVVGRLERGTYNPTVMMLHFIAGALNATLVGILAQTEPHARARNSKFKAG